MAIDTQNFIQSTNLSFFSVLFYLLSYCCVRWILFGIMMNLLEIGRRMLSFFMVFDMCTVCCGLFALLFLTLVGYTVSPRYNDALVPKDVSIIMNLLL